MGQLQGVLVRKEDRWLVGFVEEFYLGINLETMCIWGHMMYFYLVSE